jgi:hypothetical protein
VAIGQLCVGGSAALVRATVGSTSKSANLKEFVTATSNNSPLPKEIVDEVLDLQRKWSDEVDVKAEPWTI